MPAGNERRFGLTLNAGSTVDEACEATLIAHGGPENAFAATRSIILTIAMHATLLEQLGLPQERLRTVLANAMPTDLSAAHHALADCDVIVFSGRHVLQGAAQSAALSLMELARVPAIGLESGQFRHGPFEFLRPGVGVILLRSSGPDIDSIPPIADVCVKAGCTTLVLDASGQPLLSGMQIALPQNSGLAAATQMLLSLQHLNIATARRHLSENIGVPQFTSKVTI
jgi:fructoselysine-6-P-deglycase FrlB-like protein